jgi:hypothetical protein
VVQRGDNLLAALEALIGVFIEQLVQQRLEAAQIRRQLGIGEVTCIIASAKLSLAL